MTELELLKLANLIELVCATICAGCTVFISRKYRKLHREYRSLTHYLDSKDLIDRHALIGKTIDIDKRRKQKGEIQGQVTVQMNSYVRLLLNSAPAFKWRIKDD